MRVCKNCGSSNFSVEIKGYKGIDIQDDGEKIYNDFEELEETSVIVCSDCETEIDDVMADTIEEDKWNESM